MAYYALAVLAVSGLILWQYVKVPDALEDSIEGALSLCFKITAVIVVIYLTTQLVKWSWAN